jgi:Rad3-related DNA helicase
VIVLGDPRLKTKAYGRVFLESMPPSPVVSDVAVAAEFLRDRLRKRQASVPAVPTVQAT